MDAVVVDEVEVEAEVDEAHEVEEEAVFRSEDTHPQPLCGYGLVDVGGYG